MSSEKAISQISLALLINQTISFNLSTRCEQPFEVYTSGNTSLLDDVMSIEPTQYDPKQENYTCLCAQVYLYALGIYEETGNLSAFAIFFAVCKNVFQTLTQYFNDGIRSISSDEKFRKKYSPELENVACNCSQKFLQALPMLRKEQEEFTRLFSISCNTSFYGLTHIETSLDTVITTAGWAFWRALVGPTAEDEEAARLIAIEKQEREFHEFVRQQIICLIIFISLYLLSYWIISLFKSKSDSDSLYSGDEDYFVYRISVWMCSASLAISIGSIALLPFSVISSELLQRYPDNYYLQWMSWSLINSLWNYVFALSNLSLFVLLPFSYFFIESQGFSKTKNGIMQRVYETLAVCALLIVVILCLGDVVLTLMSSSVSLISITSVNLPLIYSFVSLAGVMLLLVSTPIGFAKMFGIVGEMTMNSISIPDQDDIVVNRLERYCQQRAEALNNYTVNNNIKKQEFDGLSTFYSPASHGYSPLRLRAKVYTNGNSVGAGDCGDPYYLFSSSVYGYSPIPNGTFSSIGGYGDCGLRSSEKFQEVDDYSKQSLSNGWANGAAVRMRHPSAMASQFCSKVREKSVRWCQQFTRVIKFPAIVVSLLALTGISLLMVVINSLKLMFGFRSLPAYAQYMEVHTRHSLGILGVTIESITIMYVMATSLIGFYSMPFVRALRPHRTNTSLTVIIINCSLVVVLSSALPVLANTLGITSFDLLGAYSSLKWLSNFELVLAYNLLFAAATIVCVFSKITSPVRKQILKRFRQIRCRCSVSVDEEATEKIE